MIVFICLAEKQSPSIGLFVSVCVCACVCVVFKQRSGETFAETTPEEKSNENARAVHGTQFNIYTATIHICPQ